MISTLIISGLLFMSAQDEPWNLSRGDGPPVVLFSTNNRSLSGSSECFIYREGVEEAIRSSWDAAPLFAPDTTPPAGSQLVLYDLAGERTLNSQDEIAGCNILVAVIYVIYEEDGSLVFEGTGPILTMGRTNYPGVDYSLIADGIGFLSGLKF